MTATTVVNKHVVPPRPDHVYIGRGSKWGNPFTHLPSRWPGVVKVPTRAEAVARYREFLRSRPDLVEAARRELRGRVLSCFCKPAECHGDVLARVADGGEP